MIGRLWKGVTTHENASAYEDLPLSTILPGIHRVAGYRGAYLMRRDIEDGVEFTTLTFFDSMDAIRAFAGERYEVAVVPDAARGLLLRFDETSEHFEVLLAPGQTG